MLPCDVGCVVGRGSNSDGAAGTAAKRQKFYFKTHSRIRHASVFIITSLSLRDETSKTCVRGTAHYSVQLFPGCHVWHGKGRASYPGTISCRRRGNCAPLRRSTCAEAVATHICGGTPVNGNTIVDESTPKNSGSDFLHNRASWTR